MFDDAGSPKRILVVDDNVELADVLSELIASWGYDVFTAYDGLQAVFKCRSFRPHVVLMDLSMPVMDGFEACRRLKHPAVPGLLPKLIALSGDVSAADRLRGFDAGFDCYLAKPADLEMLERKLASFAQEVPQHSG